MHVRAQNKSLIPLTDLQNKRQSLKQKRKWRSEYVLQNGYGQVLCGRTYQGRFCCAYAGPRATHCDFRPGSPGRGHHRREESRRRSPSTVPRDTDDQRDRPVPSTPECTIPSVLSHLRMIRKKKTFIKAWRLLTMHIIITLIPHLILNIIFIKRRYFLADYEW